MAAGGHLGMTALSRVTLASAGLSCLIYVLGVLPLLQRVSNFCSENRAAGHGVRGARNTEPQVLFKHCSHRSA